MNGAWSEYPVWQSSLTGVAVIDSPNLGIHRDLLVLIQGLQHGVGTPDFLLQVSVDGVTYDVTPANYIAVGAAVGAGVVLSTAVPITTSIGGSLELLHFNTATPTWARVRTGRELSATGVRQGTTYHTAALRQNYIRITNSTATNFTANAGVTVYSRQPG